MAFLSLSFHVAARETEKRKYGKNPKNSKNVFLEGGYPKMRKMKKWIFSRNRLRRFVSGREEKNAHFRARYLFWPKVFWSKTVKTRKNNKNSGFSGNGPKPK